MGIKEFGDLLDQVDRHFDSSNQAWVLGAGIRVDAGLPLTGALTVRGRERAKGDRAAYRQGIRVALWSLLCTTGLAHAVTKVQVDANAEPGICEHFRVALDADRVAAMSGDQLCQYSFEQKHGGQGYFERLDWQPVPGDPVALTMKIFDANVLPPNLQPVGGDRKRRADALDYAKLQEQHHALFVEVAPFSVTALILPATFEEVSGYMLRSRGSYCGAGDSISDKRNGLVAFYSDKNFTKSFRLSDNIYGDVVEPIEIKGEFYLVSNWFSAMWSKPFPQGEKGSYSLSLNNLHFSFDQKQIFTNTVCGLTYIKDDR
jgi:hypothetical protein